MDDIALQDMTRFLLCIGSRNPINFHLFVEELKWDNDHEQKFRNIPNKTVFETKKWP
jgi:hypothetical protein